MDEEKLKSALSFGGILLPDDIQRSMEYYRVRKLKPGEFFLAAGQVAREIGFMSEGILRVYATDSDGLEVTKYFIRENQFAVNLESYYADMPSENAMQAVVPTTLLVIQRHDLERLNEEVPRFYIFSKTISEAQLLNKLRDNDFLNFGTAKQKYVEFVRRYPDLAMYVPQHQIASYLKITPQSLSRIRKEIAER